MHSSLKSLSIIVSFHKVLLEIRNCHCHQIWFHPKTRIVLIPITKVDVKFSEPLTFWLLEHGFSISNAQVGHCLSVGPIEVASIEAIQILSVGNQKVSILDCRVFLHSFKDINETQTETGRCRAFNSISAWILETNSI